MIDLQTYCWKNYLEMRHPYVEKFYFNFFLIFFQYYLILMIFLYFCGIYWSHMTNSVNNGKKLIIHITVMDTGLSYWFKVMTLTNQGQCPRSSQPITFDLDPIYKWRILIFHSLFIPTRDKQSDFFADYWDMSLSLQQVLQLIGVSEKEYQETIEISKIKRKPLIFATQARISAAEDGIKANWKNLTGVPENEVSK